MEEERIVSVTLSENEEPISVDLREYPLDSLIIPVKIGEEKLIAQLFKIRDLGYDIQLCGSVFSLDVLTVIEAEYRKYMKETTSSINENAITSPMAGTLISIAVQAGDRVVVGQEIAVIEAMKMQNMLRATRDGTIKAVNVQAGKSVQLDEVLVTLEPLVVDKSEKSK